MHDCRKTKEDLIDLVFNEVDTTRELLILEETESCRACRDEYRLMQEALGSFDEAAHALMPTGDFWSEYHAKLEERLNEVTGSSARVIPFWRRAFQTSFSIPVPVAAAAALLLVATSVLAIRSFALAPKLQPTSGTSAVVVETRVVEVPVEKLVVEEKIVTRTVYVTRRQRQGNQPAPSVRDLPGITAKNRKDATVNPPSASLNGFQPPSDVKLTVIKGSFKDEK